MTKLKLVAQIGDHGQSRQRARSAAAGFELRHRLVCLRAPPVLFLPCLTVPAYSSPHASPRAFLSAVIDTPSDATAVATLAATVSLVVAATLAAILAAGNRLPAVA